MNTQADPNSDPDAVLAELSVLGLGIARTAARFVAMEQAAAEVVFAWLPAAGAAVSQAAVTDASHSVDAVNLASAEAAPRIDVLTRAFDRVSRSVRRTIALRRRLAAGWPRVAGPDDRAAMVRRQVARGVGAVIARVAEGERAERLFDDLSERLDDPELDADGVLPVEVLVRRICRDLGLAAAAVRMDAGLASDGLARVAGEGAASRGGALGGTMPLGFDTG